MSKGLIGSYSKAKNKANIKNEYKNNNPREIYIDKTVLNLFCTKKNIKGIIEKTNTIDIKRSFSINDSKSGAISVLKINLLYKKAINTQNTNVIIAAIVENTIISPSLVKLLYVLFFILKLLSAKSIMIKNIIEDNILLLIIILDIKKLSISDIESFNGDEVNILSKNKSKNDKNVISIVLLLTFSKLLYCCLH